MGRSRGLAKGCESPANGCGQGLVDQRRSYVVGDVADDLEGAGAWGMGPREKRVPVKPQGITGYRLESPQAQAPTPHALCKPSIFLDRNHLSSSSEQLPSKRPTSWTYFNDRLPMLEVECIHDAAEDPRICEKVLAQPGVGRAQNFSRTSVRSSLAGAPPVYAEIGRAWCR